MLLVGTNPASAGRSFGIFWRPDTRGFDYQGWRADYHARRLAGGESATSQTRARIDRFSAAAEAAGIAVLETNVFPVCTTSEKLLPKHQRDSSVFRFLLESIRPAVVAAHGATAIEEVGRTYGRRLDEGADCLNSDGTLLIATHHFSGRRRGISYEWAEQLGLRVALEAQADRR